MSNSMLLQPSIKGRVAIVTGLRTPFARQSSVFKNQSALDLGRILVTELLKKAQIEPKLVELLVFGQVIQMPQVPNIAREIVLSTPLGIHTDAYSVTRACTTSFQSVANVAQSIALGAIDIGIAGGADSSSVLPVGVSRKFAAILLGLSKAKRLSDKFKLVRQLSLKDLVPIAPTIAEYSTGLSMGQSAEQMAKTFGISREEQDKFAQHSHHKANKAWVRGYLDDEVMTAFPEPYSEWIVRDNTIRATSKLEDYAKLHPVFDKAHGSVTAGNSSPLTDGAAAMLLMSEQKAKELALTPLGFIKSMSFTASEVKENMLLGPAHAIPLALEQAGLSLKDLSLIDIHEAFASQVLANVNALASKKFAKSHGRDKAVGEIDMQRLNPLGGSIAYGHPFAATGARLIVQSLRELKRQGGRFALTSACAAGGLGAAMVLEANND